MPVSCSAPGCASRFVKEDNINFYRFPKENQQRKRWIKAMKRVDRLDPNKLWEPSSHDRLCSRHFIGGKLILDRYLSIHCTLKLQRLKNKMLYHVTWNLDVIHIDTY